MAGTNVGAAWRLLAQQPAGSPLFPALVYERFLMERNLDAALAEIASSLESPHPSPTVLGTYRFARANGHVIDALAVPLADYVAYVALALESSRGIPPPPSPEVRTRGLLAWLSSLGSAGRMVAHLDVRRFAERLSQPKLLALIEQRASRALAGRVEAWLRPFGGSGLPYNNMNLGSVIFAGVYLEPAERALKRADIPCVRHADSFWIAASSREQLQCSQRELGARLAELGLEINPQKTFLRSRTELTVRETAKLAGARRLRWPVDAVLQTGAALRLVEGAVRVAPPLRGYFTRTFRAPRHIQMVRDLLDPSREELVGFDDGSAVVEACRLGLADPLLREDTVSWYALLRLASSAAPGALGAAVDLRVMEWALDTRLPVFIRSASRRVVSRHGDDRRRRTILASLSTHETDIEQADLLCACAELPTDALGPSLDRAAAGGHYARAAAEWIRAHPRTAAPLIP